MHDFGNVKAQAGASYTTFLPGGLPRGTARLEIHVQYSPDGGKTWHQVMTTTTPDVPIKDAKLDWLAALNPERT